MVSINNPINNTVGASNSGVTNTLTVTNPSNTASSQALNLINVGGGTAGDPFQTFTVTGATSFSQGIDNSDSDTYKIAVSTALGTSDALTITTAGVVNAALNDLTAVRSHVGITGVNILSENTDNTDPGSSASVHARVAGSSAGDALFLATITAGTMWAWGLDNSDSDSWVLAASSSLGTNNVMKVVTGGSITYPLQPCFSVYPSGTLSNVTGDGTSYTVIWNTEITDRQSNFNTGTGTFTAPVTGLYQFNVNIYLGGLTALDTSANITLTTTARNYNVYSNNPGVSIVGGQANFPGSFLADMTAGDTATITVVVSGSTKTVSVLGTGSGSSIWSGYLVE